MGEGSHFQTVLTHWKLKTKPTSRPCHCLTGEFSRQQCRSSLLRTFPSEFHSLLVLYFILVQLRYSRLLAFLFWLHFANLLVKIVSFITSGTLRPHLPCLHKSYFSSDFLLHLKKMMDGRKKKNGPKVESPPHNWNKLLTVKLTIAFPLEGQLGSSAEFCSFHRTNAVQAQQPLST